MREPFCPSQPTMGTVLNSMAGGPAGLIQVAQQQTHVFHFMPELKAAVAFVVHAQIILKRPRHGD